MRVTQIKPPEMVAPDGFIVVLKDGKEALRAIAYTEQMDVLGGFGRLSPRMMNRSYPELRDGEEIQWMLGDPRPWIIDAA